jgi:flagellar FliJ protein
MKRSKRLKPVAQVEKHRERDAAQQLGRHQSELGEMQSRLDELVNYRADYQQRYNQFLSQGTGSAAIQEYRSFLKKLDQAIAHQQQLINGGQQNVAHSRHNWLQKRTRLKAIDTLVDKLQVDEHQQEAKREQQDNDERALFARRLNHLKCF